MSVDNPELEEELEADYTEALTIILSPEETRKLRYPRTARLAADLALIWVQAIAGVVLFVAYPNPYTFIISVFLIGGAQHGMGLVAHEGAHYLLVPKNRGLNDFIAAYFFAAPILLPFRLYRQRHFTHHRMVSTEHDTKRWYRRRYDSWLMLMETLRGLTGLDFLEQTVNTLIRFYRDSRNQTPTETNSVKGVKFVTRDLLSLIMTQGIILSVFLAVNPLYYFLLWLVPAITTAQLMAKIRSTVEHRPLDCDTGKTSRGGFFLDTETPCLRTVYASMWERLFFSKINFHFHGEHHLWPQTSYQYLPMLNRRLASAGIPKNSGIVYESSYTTVLYKLVIQT